MADRILVTGGTGFLGSYILQTLVQQGYQVRALRRGSKLPVWIDQQVLQQVEWVEGDILDVVALEDAMENVTAVIHSAAVVSFAKKDRAQMYHVNVEGTANVVNIALEKNIKRLVHISSVAALGRTAGGTEVTEDKKWEESKLNTHYAISKFKAELQAWRGLSEGLDTVILNPSTILGYGDWHSSSCAIFRQVYEGFNWYTDGINGFVDVEDVATAAVRLLASGISGERFIVNGDNWPFRKLQETIAAGFGKKPPARHATGFLLGIAWRLERIKSFFTRRKPLLTKESARVARSRTFFRNEKLLEALPGFRFTALEDSIRKACEKYKAAQSQHRVH